MTVRIIPRDMYNGDPARGRNESEESDVRRDRWTEHRSPDRRAERDQVFDLLCDARRRHLAALLISHGATPFDELVHQLATVPEASAAADPEQLTIALVHVHLPRLAEANVLDYDPHSGVVSPESGLNRLAPYLDWELRQH